MSNELKQKIAIKVPTKVIKKSKRQFIVKIKLSDSESESEESVIGISDS